MFNEQLHGSPHWVRTINQAFLAHRKSAKSAKNDKRKGMEHQRGLAWFQKGKEEFELENAEITERFCIDSEKGGTRPRLASAVAKASAFV